MAKKKDFFGIVKAVGGPAVKDEIKVHNDKEKDLYEKEFKKVRIDLESKLKDFESKPMNSHYFKTVKNFDKVQSMNNIGNLAQSWWVTENVKEKKEKKQVSTSGNNIGKATSNQ